MCPTPPWTIRCEYLTEAGGDESEAENNDRWDCEKNESERFHETPSFSLMWINTPTIDYCLGKGR